MTRNRIFGAICGAICFALAGCATPQPPKVQKVYVKGDTYCRIDEPLKWSRRDTKETINAIRRHNHKYRRAC